ncbi:MAG: ribonuclease HII, partial [Alphaproteobacteria bacterium]|nr:ribonuclease HII [Alphaproteobacteria bacterium]
MPDYAREAAAGGKVAGVDEVGRGAWAGPVFAA